MRWLGLLSSFLCMLWLPDRLVASPAEITAIVAELKQLQRSEDVRLIRDKSTVREPLALGTRLQLHDSLESVSGRTVVELRCPNGTTYTLRNKFRIILIPPTRAGCAVEVLSGSLDVLADQPTEENAAGVHLGADGTIYSVTVDSETLRIAALEGRVKISGDEPIDQGTALAIQEKGRSRSQIDPAKDVEPLAASFARLDVIRAKNPKTDFEAFQTLKGLHTQVLSMPDDRERRIALARAQYHFGVQSSNASYQLRRLGMTERDLLPKPEPVGRPDPDQGSAAASSEIVTLGLRVKDAQEPKGLLVTEVQIGSTAYFAGFQPGDLIVAIDKVYLEAEGMSSRIGFFKTGDQLGVTWRFVVDGQLSNEPIRTALMVGVPGTGAWMSQVELGPLVGTPYNSTHPYRDIRWYERFEWPNRRPVAGLPEAVQKAIVAFPPLLEQAEAKITALSCKTDVPQAAVNEAILKLSQELTISYYMAYGMINTFYDSALRDTNRKACQTACAANPRNPWTLAGTSAPKDPKPNACQILLAFDEFLSGVWKTVWRAPRDCSAVREEGCTFSFAGRTTQARIAKFGKVACRGDNHECDFSYELECRGTVNGIYDPILGSPIVCGAMGIDPVGTITANVAAGGDGKWRLVPLPEPKHNEFMGHTKDIDELCPRVVEAMRCVQ